MSTHEKTLNLEAPLKIGFLERVKTDLSAALIVSRREITDTLRDWRIIVPITILVTLFPFLANFAAGRGLSYVNQYGATLIMERLLPFLMLAVGFFPSSFSLIIALESFAGEKERRSLEPLLATPLTDFQFYLGKLISSMAPPVAASYLGMIVYALLLRFSINWQPDFSLVLVSFILSTAEALVMVSGAVVISSQSTSVRAANLLASFIILPMAFLLQAEAGLLLYGNYSALWLIALALLSVNILLLRLGVKSFDREHLLGQDIDQLDFKGAWKIFRQTFWTGKGLLHLYTREIPAQIKAIVPEIIFTLLVTIGGGLLVGYWGSVNFPLPKGLISFKDLVSVESITDAAGKTGLLSSFSITSVWSNNVRSLLLSGGSSIISWGILGQLLLMIPNAIIAYLTMQVPAATGTNPGLFLAVFILPHGIIEIPAAILATAQGMKIGDIMLRAPDEGGGINGMVREIAHFAKLMLAVVIPLLLIAAIIETQITPRLVVHYFGGL